MEGEHRGCDEPLAVVVVLVVRVPGQKAEIRARIVVEGMAVERKLPGNTPKYTIV